MKKSISLLFVVIMSLVLAACGEGTVEETTTSSAPETTSTSQAPTTTAPPETTTTGAPEASGDLAKLQAAMENTAEVTPSRVEGVMAMESSGGGTAEVPISMLIDPETQNTAMTMDMAAMASMGGETGEIPAEMAQLMGTMEIRQIDDVVYMKFPFFTAFLGAETEWVSMPAEEGDDMAEGMSPTGSPSDPRNYLESFSDVDGSVEEIGSEEIRGIQTTHYRLTFDEAWREKLSEEELSELEEQGPLPEDAFDMDLWIDSDALVHRMSFSADAADMATPEGEVSSITVTFDFFDFGQPVEIEAPPADQVTPVEDLSGPLGSIPEQP